MKQNQEAIYKAVLAHEGGYSDHPSDPGGKTKWGITWKVYDAYRELQGLKPRNVKNLTAEECAAIYDANYWDRVKGDLLSPGVDYAVYDFAVNSGVSRSVSYLQRCLVVNGADLGDSGPANDGVDGNLGMLTLAAVQRVNDRDDLIRELCRRRMAFLMDLKTWKTFGKGWTTRVENVQRGSLALARGGMIGIGS